MFVARALTGIILAGGLATGLLAAPAQASEAVVYSFGSYAGDGLLPYAGLIDVGGTLYGTTWYGGANNGGTVFSITTAGVETVLHSFGSGSDGTYPQAGLINVNGTLYGTTTRGGTGGCSKGCGTVFSMKTDGTGYSLLYSFKGSTSDGQYPSVGLTNVNGTLYGTTCCGGSDTSCEESGCGTVFQITTAGVETVLHSFKAATANTPVAGLINVNGTLYGTTYYGGAGGGGTVFKITTDGSVTVLHSFDRRINDGAYPAASLTRVGDWLYGTTFGGGKDDKGTVFKIDTQGKEKVLHSFKGGDDGANPYGGSLINVGGALYGTTTNGGSETGCDGSGCGTVFKITAAAGESVLYAFGSSFGDGENPSAGLVNVGGTLYGTTEFGGQYGQGTVFSVTR